MSSPYRLFAQLDFERALGNAAIDALERAVNAKAQFESEPEFGQAGYDQEATLAEVAGSTKNSDNVPRPMLRGVSRNRPAVAPTANP